MAAPGPQPPPAPQPSNASPDRSDSISSVGDSTYRGAQTIWQTRGFAACMLWPLSLFYRALVGMRRWGYRAGWLKAEHPGRPVIVVGNVIAGGAGKTPVVIALVRHLQARGLRAGVISRGYGRSTTDCRAVTPASLASAVGDEPALMARSFADGPALPIVPIFVAPERIAAARALLCAYPDTDVIVCDDGLQHLALKRDLEICVFNDEGIGNGFLLPAGPLREPWPRQVDFVLHAGKAVPGASSLAFGIQRTLAPYAVRSDGTQVPLAQLQRQPLHAIAAVARPQDFFAMLQAQGLTIAHAESLPDHYDFNSWNRLSDKRYTLICTEKDAVKLWAQHPDALAVPLQVQIDPAFFDALDARLDATRGLHTSAVLANRPPPLSSPRA